MTTTEQTAPTRTTWTTARVHAQDLAADEDTAFFEGKWRLVYDVWTPGSERGPVDILGPKYPGIEDAHKAWESENFAVVVRYRCPTPQDQDDDKIIVLEAFDLVEIQVKAGTI